MGSVEAPPNHPKTLGGELRRLREAAGVSLDQMISEIKVSRRILEALESGKYQYLPEQVFCRNFVRQYARFIGSDDEPLVAAFDAAWERFRLSSGSHPAVVLVDAPPKPPIRWRFWFPIIVAAIIVLVVLVVVVGGSKPPDQLTVDPRRAGKSSPTPTGFPVAVASSPTPFDAAVVPLVDDPDLVEVVSILIRVEEGKECWIHYRDREGHTGQQLLRGFTELPLELAGPVLLSLGNAAAVEIRAGETEYKDLGRPGQVIHCEIDGRHLVKLGARASDE